MATKESIMSKVMKLLALAADENASDAERELAAQNAENMMAKHMIDRMDLKPEEKSKVVKDTWSLNIGDADVEFRGIIRSLVLAILRHNNIRFYPRLEYGVNDLGHADYNVEVWTIVGFPEDITYAEAIWFRVFREFVMNVSPKWDSSKPLSDNVYHFIHAGYSWIDTYRAGRKAQYSEWPAKMPNGAPKLRAAYKKALADRDEEFTKTRRRQAYRNSFAESFTGTIAQRLKAMRTEAGKVTDKDRFALALRSTMEYVDDEFERLFGDEVRAMQAAADAAAAKAPKRRYKIKYRDDYDHAAWERGAAVASKVNLSVDPEVRRKKTGELK